MATPKNEIEKTTRTGKKKPASPDSLVKGSKNDTVELSEHELKDVSGGSRGWDVKSNTKA